VAATPSQEVERVFSGVRFAAFRAVRWVGTTFGVAALVLGFSQYRFTGTMTAGIRGAGVALGAVILSAWLFNERTHRIGTALQVGLVGLGAAFLILSLGFTPGAVGLLLWLCVVSTVFYGSWGAGLSSGAVLLLLGAAVARGALGDEPPAGAVFGPVPLMLRWAFGTLTVAVVCTAAVNATVRGLTNATRALFAANEERERNLESLARARRLEVAGRLAGGVAHDLNNMLTPVIAYGTQLRESYPHSPDVAEAASSIVTAAQSAAGLVRQLLAFSRPGTQAIAPVDVHAVLDATVTLLRRTIDRTVNIECHFEARRFTVLGDAGMLQNALVNLALNARDAMPQGGALTLSTSNPSTESLEICVKDTGTGMTPEVQARVFEPFFTTKKEGVGLGLASVFGTVQQHHGTVDLTSAPGQGATFRLKLPLTSDALTLRIAESKPVERARSGRVLVVDDEELVRRVIVRLLTRRGLQCKEAADGQKGLEVYTAEQGDFELIVMDSEMPNMSGRALLEQVRARDKQVPVIVVSGYLKDASADALALDARLRMVAKPFDPERLMRAVDELLTPA
jgi:signal transduction histidine kinase/CheY-like chemotaxis protein